jgi:predicted lipid-binding transport protein (Tim44 family)
MNSPIIQLLVLAAVAVFLILKLRGVLGTREGFEKPAQRDEPEKLGGKVRDFRVIEGSADRDILDHFASGSDQASAIAKMKGLESGFSVSDFLKGARGAYEMILMSFDKGELEKIKPFLADDVFESFQDVVSDRQSRGLKVDSSFVGLREIVLEDADFDPKTNRGEMTVRFVGEITSVVKDANGQTVEGNSSEIKRQRDVWSFARVFGGKDPNWQLVATGE